MKKDALLLGGLLFLGVCVFALAIFTDFFLSDSPVPREKLSRLEDLSPPSHLEDSDDSPITKDPKDLDGPLVTGDPSVSWPIYISTMTHLEGDWTEAATEKIFFDNQAARVRYGLDIAEDYGALLTIESEIPMAQGMVAFDDNFFAEVLERGHGVGTHCDISPDITYSDSAIIEEFAARKKLIDDLVGENQNLGCSGGGGYSDWYAGATGAGFSYLNGIVGFHYLALPENERPQGWTDRSILSEWYHYPAPQNETYFYPFLISKLGFDEDIHGDLLVGDGSLGNPSTLAEMGTWSLDGSADCGSAKCPLTDEDTETLELFIRDFSADFDGSRPAKITLYLPTSIFTSANEDALRFLFARLEVLAQEGLVTWETQRGVYDGVMEYYDTLQK